MDAVAGSMTRTPGAGAGTGAEPPVPPQGGAVLASHGQGLARGGVDRVQYEPLTNIGYIDVDRSFEFPPSVREAFDDPRHTVIVVPDVFGVPEPPAAPFLFNPGGQLTLGDYAPDYSHGGMISALLQSHAVVREGIEDGRVTVVNLNLGRTDAYETGHRLAAAMEAIPDEHRSQVIVSIAATIPERQGTDRELPPAWERAIREVGDLAGYAPNGRSGRPGDDGGEFHAFIALGNNGPTGPENAIYDRLSAFGNIRGVASSTAVVGADSAERPLNPTSNTVGRREDADPVPSTVRVTPDGDINGDGRPDLALPASSRELSQLYGSRPVDEFLQMRADAAFATPEQVARLHAGGFPEPGVLYSLQDLLEAQRLPASESAEPRAAVTAADYARMRYPMKQFNDVGIDPPLAEVYFDPVALSEYHATHTAVDAVMPFVAGPDGYVRALGGEAVPELVDTVPGSPSTSYAVPVAIAELLERQAGVR